MKFVTAVAQRADIQDEMCVTVDTYVILVMRLLDFRKLDATSSL